jgi:tetratricopeptide (TPR) repeat protein
MAEQRRSLQERIRERQQGGFVGRQGQVIQFRENLGFPVDDERRRFLFNIHGDAGVGKTFLTRQLERVAAADGALTGYVDETAEDVAAVLTAIAKGFARGGSRLADFEKRADEYRRRRHELESDPQAPDGVAAFLTRTAVTVGLAAARDVPIAGSLLAPVDPLVTAELANRAREYVARKFRDHGDVRLLLSPADELTPLLVTGINRVAAGRGVALFFDTYERTGPLLDEWLRGLYAGRYGDLPDTVITTITGQKPLSPNQWGEYLPVIADVPLEPFSEAEARQFLASKHITDEAAVQVIVTLSGCLPLWLATLADARRRGGADVGDPTGDAVERFLRWEPDPVRREIAVAAALPRVLNQDVLAVITPAQETTGLFGWLRGLPFVSQRGEAWAYHDVVRAAMLRLRRAEAPVTWRSAHAALAAVNADWAGRSVGPDGVTWTSPQWIDHTREEAYHLLCADPHGNLPAALASAVRAAGHSAVRARQWAALISDAGRDAGSGLLSDWGRRLAQGIAGADVSAYLTALINDARLDQATLIIAQEQRGEAYRVQRRYADALADLNRVIEADPGRVSAIGSRGEAYRLTGRHREARADFDRAIDLDPGYAWALGSRGRVHRATGHHEEALADFSRAIDLDPGYAWAIGSRGETYRDLGRYDQALADFNRAIELRPGYWWAVSGRGETYRLLGRYDEALADLNDAVKADPDNAWALGHRGQAYHALGCYTEARADLVRASELEPAWDWLAVSRDRATGAKLDQVKLDGQGRPARGSPGVGKGLVLDAVMQDPQVGRRRRDDGEDYLGVTAAADDPPLGRVDAVVGTDLAGQGGDKGCGPEDGGALVGAAADGDVSGPVGGGQQGQYPAQAG